MHFAVFLLCGPSFRCRALWRYPEADDQLLPRVHFLWHPDCSLVDWVSTGATRAASGEPDLAQLSVNPLRECSDVAVASARPVGVPRLSGLLSRDWRDGVLDQRELRKSRYLRSGVSGQLGLSRKLFGVSDVPSSGRAALPPAYDTVIECPTMALKFLRM